MKARAPLALTPADPQPQPHPARQGHHIPAILVAQPHMSAAPRAVLPGRHQDTLPLRPPPCRHPSHLAPPGVTDHCSYQRITPAAFAGLEKATMLFVAVSAVKCWRGGRVVLAATARPWR